MVPIFLKAARKYKKPLLAFHLDPYFHNTLSFPHSLPLTPTLTHSLLPLSLTPSLSLPLSLTPSSLSYSLSHSLPLSFPKTVSLKIAHQNGVFSLPFFNISFPLVATDLHQRTKVTMICSKQEHECRTSRHTLVGKHQCSIIDYITYILHHPPKIF